MQTQSVLPDTITYNTMTSACGKGERPKKALQMLEVMQQQGVLPDVITYSALTGLRGDEQSGQALQMIKVMQHQCLERDVKNYHPFISMCERGAQPERAP